MKVIASIKEVRNILLTIPKSKSIGFVPTMGYLHKGHIALICKARQETDIVFASIFVNPAQFGPDEDLEKYPRNIDSDIDMLESNGCDILFTPLTNEIYGTDYKTWVSVDEAENTSEAKCRPGHFRGVTTIVAKLFNIVQPTHAYFGQKDILQFITIRKMVEDLNFNIKVKMVETVREEDGLAMSSRNSYLSPTERKIACILYIALKEAEQVFKGGVRSRSVILERAINIIKDESRVHIEYVTLSSLRTGQEIENISEEDAVLSGAIKVGKTRLLDNIIFKISS